MESDSIVRVAVTEYVATWNELDPMLRAERIPRFWRDDSVLATPSRDFVGASGLLEAIAAFRRGYPTDRAVITSAIEVRRRIFRIVGWVQRADGTRWGEVMDVGEVSDEGKIVRIWTFPGATPPA